MKIKTQIIEATKRAEGRLSGFMRENRRLRAENIRLRAENRRLRVQQTAEGMAV